MDGDRSSHKLESILQDPSSEPIDLPLEYLRKITNNFSDEQLLGEGGFGKVYKGVLQNGEFVAVKKLDQLKPGVQEKQFENEVYHLMRLRHPNIVRFVGYCYETRNKYVPFNGKYVFAEKQQRLLCLEYLPNGSLDGYISDASSGLDWGTRFKIIKGICCGIHYLHEECRDQINSAIIHLDLKPANILLDDNMVPKVADFGLSRLFDGKKAQTYTANPVGTFGYMAPEYMYRHVITTKADIYSLGVLIIEIITGVKLDPFNFSEVIEAVLPNWRTRSKEALSETDCNQIKCCLEIGLKCIRGDRNERPAIKEIVKSLDEWESSYSKSKPENLFDTKKLLPSHEIRRAFIWPQHVISCSLSCFFGRLRVIAELRHEDLFHSANIVTSIEFDRDDELFATAGVSKRIKVFEFSSVVNEPSDVHCPVVELATQSKLSCLSWNKYSKNVIASSDYEGIVTVWDVQTHQSVMEYKEHEKRAWSVDFSRTEPSMLVSGSDDCKVKVWCTKQEASVINIDMKAKICSVEYNPGSSFYVAVGSADHHIHYFDLRNPSAPVHIFGGHRKAVSYVKFLSNNELASASTDSTLRLWDVKDNCWVRTFRGHTNLRNFVGLSVNSEYIACGSETNEVFVYHKAVSRPAASYRFVSSDLDDADDDPDSSFISAACWKSDSLTMLTANSQGTIKVLVLAP